MPSQKNPKHFQILLALSLMLGIPAVIMAYSSQAKAHHGNIRQEQSESRKAKSSEVGEKRELDEARDIYAKEADERAEANESQEKAETEEVEDRSSGIPSALWQVSENGEDAYDSAKSGDWARALKQLNGLQQAQSKLPQETQASKQDISGLNTGISNLAHAIVGKNQFKAMDAANQITLHAINMSGQFKSNQPVELSRLDYLGRELELGALAQDIPRIKATTRQINRTWQALRPNIQAHGGSAQAQKFDTIVHNILTAKSIQDYHHLASMELDEVDLLETVFNP
jgi:hypothetical protein